MYYDYYQSTPCEYDELVSKGICPINPTLSALQEVILSYLRELAYYILQLKELGANNEIIKEHVIEAISGVISNIDYNQIQFQRLLEVIAQDLSQAKSLYSKLCTQNNLEANFLKSAFKSGQKFEATEIIKKGEKSYIQRNADLTSEQKSLFDIMLFLLKNLCIRIIQIRSYEKDYDNAYNAILVLLNTMNTIDIDFYDAKSTIEKCTSAYYDIVKALCFAQEEAHGERKSVYIQFAPRNGKAILVSGIDMTHLEAVLEATKDRGVDVYTHGITMLMAHTLSKFRTYPHLVGHFGKGADNSLFDFAAFPGAILATKYLFQKVEYLYRGRIFTTDSFASSGIIKIKDNNYEPLIQAALESKGFTKKQQEMIIRVGFRQKEMEEKVQDVIGKMERNEIKRLYIIGLLNYASDYKEYFEKFLELMPADCYALSLAYDKNEENILHVDSFYDYLFIYKVLEKINEKRSLNQLKISIFITKCDQYTIANIINFVNMGIKSIYLCKCLPSLINPAMVTTMRKTFNLNEFSTPEEDLAKTLLE